jgi:hypothetical protein
MKRAIYRYRASTNDTRPITTRVAVAAWVTPLIKGYNRPLEQLWQMCELRPFGGVDVSAVHLDPPAIGVADVGPLAFAPHDPGTHRW